MGRDRVPKQMKQVQEQFHGGFELVGDAEEAHLLAGLNKRPNKLTWQRRYNALAPDDTGIFTPFGWLEVRSAGGGGFNAYRNDEPLYHTTCRTQPGGEGRRSPSRFVTRTAAQAAAELHLAQGWSNYEREPDCLSFDWETLPMWERLPRIAREVCASDIADEHCFGLDELRRISHPGGYPFELAWETKNLHRPAVLRERWAQFDGQPLWRREAQGWLSLKTPYGELVARRDNNAGWIVERNGVPLRYVYPEPYVGIPDQKLVFDSYLDAQTRALMWAYYLDKEKLMHWYEPPQVMLAAA
jgi:hypothetical protein